jgi:hypothetical protein
MEGSALYMDWTKIQNFSQSEFPDGVLEYMTPVVISSLQEVRASLPRDHLIYPSPLARAHVRHEVAGSQHSTHNGTRLANATDFFVLKKHLPRVYMEVTKHPKINGCGFYKGSTYRGSGDDWVMVHIDCRPANEKLFWVADKDSGSYKYTYITSNPDKYFEILMELSR